MADSPTPLSPQEIEILRASFYDGGLRVHEGGILAVKTNVAFRGTDYVRAFRSLRARGYFDWRGQSVAGGQLYELNEAGRAAFPAKQP